MSVPYSDMNQTELVWALEQQTGEARRIAAQPGDIGMTEVLAQIQQILDQYPNSPPATPAGEEV